MKLFDDAKHLFAKGSIASILAPASIVLHKATR